MYKILIVDDEELVRTSITTIVDWASLGFTEVYQAENGIEALALALKVKPDLVLTDIRMPFMDGLQLSAQLREKLPSTSIVILSGHDEFKYAQQAIAYGILDYILKPIGPDSLYEKMLEIKTKLDLNLNKKKYLEKIRSQLHQSLPLLTEKFLNSLLYNSFENKAYSKTLEFLEIPLTPGPYLICVIEPDLLDIYENDLELYSFAVKNIATETFSSKHPVFSDAVGRIIVVFCVDTQISEEENHSITFELLNILKNNVNFYLKLQLTAAKGSIVNEINSLYMSYNEAISALECKYTLGKNRIYDIRDINYVESSIVYPHDAYVEFMDAVKSARTDLIIQASGSIVAALKSRHTISPANIKLVFIDIITSLLKLLAMTKGTSLEVWNKGLSLFSELDKQGTVEELTNATTEFAITVSVELAASRSKSTSIIVCKVIEYIKDNYQLQDISLFSAANYASVNASYLSTLFKKETGKNFVDYLNRVRIEKAMELLRTTDLKAYEVAYMTGFSNPHYFSILFKKHIGITPSEFKGGTDE